MSRRFGRNQKRRMREALEQAQRRSQYFVDEMHRKSADVESLNAIIEGFKEALGKHSILFEPIMKMDLASTVPNIRTAEKIIHQDWRRPSELKQITMGILNSRIEKNSVLRRQHFLVSYQGISAVGYAIDSRELEVNRLEENKHMIRNYIAKFIADEFIRQFIEQERAA